MISSPFSINRFRWIFVGAIVVIGLTQVKMLQMLEVPWQLNLIDSAVTNALLTVALFAVVSALRFYVPEKNRVVYLLLWCLVIAGGWILATWGILNVILKGNGYLNFCARFITRSFCHRRVAPWINDHFLRALE
ncbi:MAG: hypothetical protein ACHQD9_03780 [Chitinophagales bacterium]